jgi:nucleotide-binding universal stress UspA family protein
MAQAQDQHESHREYFRLAHNIGECIVGPGAARDLQTFHPTAWEPANFEVSKYSLRRAEVARIAFSSGCAKAGVEYEFRSERASTPNLSDVVIEYGRASDLVIMGQTSKVIGLAFGSDLEQVLMSTGRPTLVIPYGNDTEFSADSILIAWNGSRECTRAAFDSIPLLDRTKEVLIVHVGRQREVSEPCVRSGMKMAEALLRHGIKATFECLVSTGDEGQTLMMKVRDRGVRLLVMGAYGHTRLHEFILGGATRSVLNGMRCPVFFSH